MESRQRSEFSVTAMEQISAHQGNIHRFVQPPAQAAIQFAVCRDILITDTAHKSECTVELETMRQVQQ